MSHLIKERTLFKDLETLKECVEMLGATWIGARESVRVFNTDIPGTAFHVPGMEYPVVVTPEHELIYETEGDTNTMPYRQLYRIIQKYVSRKIIDGASAIRAEDVRTWTDDRNIFHVDMKKGNKKLKFKIDRIGSIKAYSEGYEENGCYADIETVIEGKSRGEDEKTSVYAY